MSSLSSAMNPNVVKTALDMVLMPEFSIKDHPQIGSALTPEIFNQEETDKAAEITELFKGSGYWDQRSEEQNVPGGTPRVTNQQTHSVLNFAKSLDIPKNFFDDDQHSVVKMAIRDMGQNARVTRDNHAMGMFRDGFTGATYTTSDSVALFSNSHANINGDTVDNLGTAALAPTSLETGIVALMTQLAQDGTIKGHTANTLVVPPELFKEAIEITESQLISDSSDNAVNWVSSKFGLKVFTSPYLGAAAGGSATAWFLLAKNHSLMRWERQAMETSLVDWVYQRNNNYIYKGEYREVYGAISYDGIWASNGTT